MRLKNLFGMAAMLALAASCSENELGESGGTGANENGPHYATFTIKLPTTNGTRAAGDPTYEDGTPNEYAVNNATLLVFRGKVGEKEAKAEFVESKELGDMKPWTGVDDNPNVITTEANITAKLNNFDSSYTGNYYAVIMLNNNMTGSNKKVKLPVRRHFQRLAESQRHQQHDQRSERILHGKCRESEWNNNKYPGNNRQEQGDNQ